MFRILFCNCKCLVMLLFSEIVFWYTFKNLITKTQNYLRKLLAIFWIWAFYFVFLSTFFLPFDMIWIKRVNYKQYTFNARLKTWYDHTIQRILEGKQKFFNFLNIFYRFVFWIEMDGRVTKSFLVLFKISCLNIHTDMKADLPCRGVDFRPAGGGGALYIAL